MFENGRVTTGSGHHLRSVPIGHSEMVARSFAFPPALLDERGTRKAWALTRGKLKQVSFVAVHQSSDTLEVGKPFFLCSIELHPELGAQTNNCVSTNQPTSSAPYISNEVWEVAKPLL